MEGAVAMFQAKQKDELGYSFSKQTPHLSTQARYLELAGEILFQCEHRRQLPHMRDLKQVIM